MAKVAGVALLEAMVALVILSIALMAAFSWFDRGIVALIKVDQISMETSAVQETISRLRLTDLVNRRQGSLDYQNYRVDWRAVPKVLNKDGVSPEGNRGKYQFSLFEVELMLYTDSRLIGRYKLYLNQHKTAGQR